MAHWIVFGIVQVILAGFAVGLMSSGGSRRQYLWQTLLGTGGLLLVINLLWYDSGGMQGPYAASMRGGMQGFWFSTVTFAEVMLLGVIAWLRER